MTSMELVALCSAGCAGHGRLEVTALGLWRSARAGRSRRATTDLGTVATQLLASRWGQSGDGMAREAGEWCHALYRFLPVTGKR